MIPRIAPITLYGLLITIVLLFAIQNDHITSQPLDVARIALPLLGYFAGMWMLGFVIGRAMNLGYPRTATLAFTVASNDFELAIAVAVGVWGASSGQALAGVVGPLIEVPVLLTLVYVALWLRRRWWAPASPPRSSGRASRAAALPAGHARAAQHARDVLDRPPQGRAGHATGHGRAVLDDEQAPGRRGTRSPACDASGATAATPTPPPEGPSESSSERAHGRPGEA